MHLRRKGFWCSTWMIFKQKERKGMELLVNIVVMLFFIGLFGCCADFAVFVVFVVSSMLQLLYHLMRIRDGPRSG